jgi:uncharacterized protein (TIGR02246 family)
MMSSTSDEQRIRDVWARFERAWSAADPRATAAVWDVESDHRRLAPGPGGERRGRAEVERALAEAFTKRTPGAARSMRCPILSVRFVRPDVAIVDGTLQVTAPTGMPDRIAVGEPFTAVMTKQGEEWLIAASRVGRASPVPPFAS